MKSWCSVNGARYAIYDLFSFSIFFFIFCSSIFYSIMPILMSSSYFGILASPGYRFSFAFDSIMLSSSFKNVELQQDRVKWSKEWRIADESLYLSASGHSERARQNSKNTLCSAHRIKMTGQLEDRIWIIIIKKLNQNQNSFEPGQTSETDSSTSV